MAVVLADGNPASVRALDLAFVPGLLVRHEHDQLVVVHGWREPSDAAALMPIHAAVDHIAKSRVAQSTLNYKVETVRLQPVADAAGAGGSSNTAPDSANMPPAPGSPSKDSAAAGAAPAVPSKAARGGKGAGAQPGAAATEGDAVPGGHPASDVVASGGDGAAAAAAAAAATAQRLIEYVEQRSAHHRCRALVLGVGNAQVGKSLSIGSVCREVISRCRPAFNTFCMKATGPSVRPTAAMRFMVLVIPGTTLRHLEYVLSIANAKKGDRVGVLIVVNNGRPKPAEGVSHMSGEAFDESGVMTVAEVTRRCTAMLAAFGLCEAAQGDPDSAAANSATETFPLVNHVALEPAGGNTTPTVNESGLQLVKFVGGLKVDFFVLPPRCEGLSDSYVQLCLSAPKPHILLVKN